MSLGCKVQITAGTGWIREGAGETGVSSLINNPLPGNQGVCTVTAVKYYVTGHVDPRWSTTPQSCATLVAQLPGHVENPNFLFPQRIEREHSSPDWLSIHYLGLETSHLPVFEPIPIL